MAARATGPVAPPPVGTVVTDPSGATTAVAVPCGSSTYRRPSAPGTGPVAPGASSAVPSGAPSASNVRSRPPSWSRTATAFPAAAGGAQRPGPRSTTAGAPPPRSASTSALRSGTTTGSRPATSASPTRTAPACSPRAIGVDEPSRQVGQRPGGRVEPGRAPVHDRERPGRARCGAGRAVERDRPAAQGAHLAGVGPVHPYAAVRAADRRRSPGRRPPPTCAARPAARWCPPAG